MEVQTYPNYRITQDGILTNIHTGRVLSTHVNSQTGYRMVGLWKQNKCKHETLHRLLATHFIPNPDGKRYVDHIDRNKLNNCLANLRWVDGTENNLNSGGQDREMHCIYYRKDRGTYRVIVQRYGVSTYVGSTKTLDEAKALRDEILAA